MMSLRPKLAANIRAVWPFSMRALTLPPLSRSWLRMDWLSSREATMSARSIWPSRARASRLVSRRVSTTRFVLEVGGLEEGGEVGLVVQAQVGVGVDEQADGLGLVGGGGEDERGIAVGVLEVGPGVLVEEGLGGGGLAVHGGGHERGKAVGIQRVAVHPGLLVGLDERHVTGRGGLDEIVDGQGVAGLADFLAGMVAPAASAAGQERRKQKARGGGRGEETTVGGQGERGRGEPAKRHPVSISRAAQPATCRPPPATRRFLPWPQVALGNEGGALNTHPASRISHPAFLLLLTFAFCILHFAFCIFAFRLPPLLSRLCPMPSPPP